MTRERKSLFGQTVKPGGGSDSILAGLFSQILGELHTTFERFNHLMELFLSDKRNGIHQNVKDRASARGNLRKELLKADMSWKVFCKGLKFLNVRKFELTVKLHHLNGQVTVHTTKVINLGDPIFNDRTFVEDENIVAIGDIEEDKNAAK